MSRFVTLVVTGTSALALATIAAPAAPAAPAVPTSTSTSPADTSGTNRMGVGGSWCC